MTIRALSFNEIQNMTQAEMQSYYEEAQKAEKMLSEEKLAKWRRQDRIEKSISIIVSTIVTGSCLWFGWAIYQAIPYMAELLRY